jgi:hypothetical protein
MNGFGTIASVVAGFKAGAISEAVAVKLLKELGADNDVASLLGLGAGIIGGIAFGNIIGDAVSDVFDGLF